MDSSCPDGIVDPIDPSSPDGTCGLDGIADPGCIAGIGCPEGAGCGPPPRGDSLGNTVAPVAICALISAFITG
jgi:hypothetical protein